MSDTPIRSDNPKDYQHIRQPIGSMLKRRAEGETESAHSHDRDQLLFAASGVMRVSADDSTWVIPTDRAIYIPAGTVHSATMQSDVEMCSLFISSGYSRNFPNRLRVFYVTQLLERLIVALADETYSDQRNRRGDLISELIEIEIMRARKIPLSVPTPKDKRLQRLCSAILADPSNSDTLALWSETVGASARTLNRLFDQDLGMSFVDWRLRVRIDRAIEALARDTPVGVVAKNCGYSSTSAFSAAFRKAVGKRPTDLLGISRPDIWRDLR